MLTESKVCFYTISKRKQSLLSLHSSVQKGLKERWDIKVIRKSASYPGESLQLLEPVLRRSHNRCQARHIRLRLQADFPLLNHKLHVLTLGANDVTEHQVRSGLERKYVSLANMQFNLSTHLVCAPTQYCGMYSGQGLLSHISTSIRDG